MHKSNIIFLHGWLFDSRIWFGLDELFSIGLNRAITLIAEAKPGRISSSLIKDLGEHPEDKKPVRIMKGQYGPYIKHKSLNATIPEEKDPTEITMEDALISVSYTHLTLPTNREV